MLWIVFAALARAEALSVGPLAGMNLNEIPDEWRQVLASANEDCIEVEALRIPKHAEPFPLENLDGGTRAFVGDKYVLIVRKSLFPLTATGEILGYSYGYELYFGTLGSLDKNPGTRALVSKVWFVTRAQMGAIQKANWGALTARMPPLEKYLQLREKNASDLAEDPDKASTPAEAVRPPVSQETRQP